MKRLRALDFDSKYGSMRSGAGSGVPPSQAAFKQFFEREIAILASIRHPNVVNFIGASHKPPNRCLVTEYCARGSLDQLLHKSGGWLGGKMWGDPGGWVGGKMWGDSGGWVGGGTWGEVPVGAWVAGWVNALELVLRDGNMGSVAGCL